mmetsp:Transcript_5108/g.11327  ORF Transcript_5108/g.11327 Transcript_5108/m.11327 type:complete len:256 (-) Transcript_5108:13-780(-)
MVSEIATSSSARSLEMLSHSASLDLQLASMSARNFLSSASASSVSSRSWDISAMLTPSLPMRVLFSSMAAVCAAISFFFAAMSASALALASASWPWLAAKLFSISSLICFKMPTISPLCGTYSAVFSKKEESSCWSSLLMLSDWTSMRFRSLAAWVCKKLPPMPELTAVMALPKAAMLAERSASSLVNSPLSLERSASAEAIAANASSRPAFASFRAASSCTFSLLPSSMLELTCGAFVSAAAMPSCSVAPEVLQ